MLQPISATTDARRGDGSKSLGGRKDYCTYGSVVAQSGLMPSVGYAGMWQHHDSGINLTWYRGYQPAAGRWLSRDPIEESGGLNLFAYVDGDPINFIDSEGLRGNLPGYRPNNARNAAGYHDLRGGFVCEEWNCPLRPFMCTSRDKKRPTDFIPPATSANKSDAPDGCECVRLGYRPDWSSPTPEARDIADAYSTYKDANRMKWRWLQSIKPFPHWYRIGGVGR